MPHNFNFLSRVVSKEEVLAGTCGEQGAASKPETVELGEHQDLERRAVVSDLERAVSDRSQADPSAEFMQTRAQILGRDSATRPVARLSGGETNDSGGGVATAPRRISSNVDQPRTITPSPADSCTTNSWPAANKENVPPNVASGVSGPPNRFGAPRFLRHTTGADSTSPSPDKNNVDVLPCRTTTTEQRRPLATLLAASPGAFCGIMQEHPSPTKTSPDDHALLGRSPATKNLLEELMMSGIPAVDSQLGAPPASQPSSTATIFPPGGGLTGPREAGSPGRFATARLPPTPPLLMGNSLLPITSNKNLLGNNCTPASSTPRCATPF